MEVSWNQTFSFCIDRNDWYIPSFDHSSRASISVQETWGAMGAMMRSVAPTTEWIAFASRSEYLLDPDTPLRNPMTINYPGKDDPSVIPVHMGILERKKRFTKTYKGSLFVSVFLSFVGWFLFASFWIDQRPSILSLLLDSYTNTLVLISPSILIPNYRSSYPNVLSELRRPLMLVRTSSISKVRRDWEVI